MKIELKWRIKIMKRQDGQYFTRTNPFMHQVFFNWLEQIPEPDGCPANGCCREMVMGLIKTIQEEP